LLERTISSAQAELSRTQRDYRDQQITTQADFQEAEAALELARDEMNRYQQLVKSGAVTVVQLKEKQAAVKSARARRKRTEATLNPTAATVAIAQERIAQEQAKGEATLATLRKEREALIQRRVEFQNQLSHDQKELQQIQSEQRKSVIRASSDGIILNLNLRNPGQVVRPSDAIAQIAPNNVPLLVKATVATQDINHVAIGQNVQLRIFACPYPDYGTLNGVVSAISPDAVTPQTNSAGATSPPATTEADTNPSASYFEVTIQPERLSLGNGDRQCSIKPGMQANADIISKEETPLQFILRKARLLTDL
jgi:HlyD family secretion protein